MKGYAIIMITVMQTCLKNIKNKILTWRKVIKSSVYNLCRFSVQYARLMRQKTDAIFIGEKIVLKGFVKI